MEQSPIDVLQSAGLQVTPQRLAVLRAVWDHPHVTADRVAEIVRAEIGAISRQSVYNALGVLVEKGLLRRIQPFGSPSLFEDRGDHHHHLICRACGRVEDVDCAVGASRCLRVENARGYEIDEADVVHWGRCPECLARHKPPDAANPPGRDDCERQADAEAEGGTQKWKAS